MECVTNPGRSRPRYYGTDQQKFQRNESSSKVFSKLALPVMARFENRLPTGNRQFVQLYPVSIVLEEERLLFLPVIDSITEVIYGGVHYSSAEVEETKFTFNPVGAKFCNDPGVNTPSR